MGKRTNTAKWTGKNWRIDVQRDGQRRSFYSSTPGRKGQREANGKADQWLDDGIEEKGLRVEDIYPKWLEDLKLTTSTSNWRPLDSRWRKWVNPVIGHKRVSQLTEKDLQDIINKMYAGNLSKKTLQNACIDLRAFLKYCRKARLTKFVPEELSIPSGARLKGKTILQPESLKTLFQIDTTARYGKVETDPFIHAYRFLALTGLRPGELIGLRWEDIQGRMVFVRRSINILGETTTGKNENALRSFCLSDLAYNVLMTQQATTGEVSGPVFPVDSEKQLYDRWRLYCKANRIPACSLYELRHTFVSVVKTLPAGTVKDLVGHSKDMDTFGIYGHTLAGEAQKTAQSVNGVFEKLLGNT